jgi:hypothetical protein
MYSTQAYLYQQRTQVLLLLDNCGQYFTTRYNPVYAKKLTINLGIDNVLTFSMVNQDEKPVNVAGCTFTFRVLSQSGTKLLLELPMVILNAPTGQVKVTIPSNDLLEIQAQPASYSITCQRGNLDQAVFTNAQAGARAPLDLVNSVFPRFVPSTPLTIPTIKLSAQASVDGTDPANWPKWAGNPYWTGNGDGTYWNAYTNTEFYTSFIEPRSALTTIQMDLDQYTGTIKAQWAENYQSLWHNITESTTYYNETKTISMNVEGWYPLLRLCFNSSIFSTPTPPGIPAVAYAVCNNGVLTAITVTNGGAGYLAPPKISILGDGAGATARAVMSQTYPADHPQAGMGYGTVQSIEVLTGGSGYWPIPSGGINPTAYPVPPANQGAFVAISTGYVENILYR